ncbi:MAG: anti-sigma factor antagonist [Clostridiales bacterium]|nr:anti-sigma factor antagonist [Clostridiales bacterium]
MNSSIKGNELTITLSGRITSSNAFEEEKAIFECIASEPCDSIVLDVKELEYISSAGLRTLLKLQKEKGNVKIINVSRDVYEIFDMTGFTGIMDIQKALREFNIEGLEKVGQGGTAAVYRLDEDKIIKVFKPVFPIYVIQHEKELAQKLFLAGIPTAVPYDVVKCGDGNIGVIYEMLDANSMLDLIVKEPENAEKYVCMMADLLKEASKIEVKDLNDLIPKMTNGLQVCVDKGILTNEEKEKYAVIYENTPDTDDFIHGDFHPGNIMMVGDELMLIDLSSASKGHVIFDLAGVGSFLNGMSRILRKEYYIGFSGLQPEIATHLWKVFLDYYFKGRDAEFIKKAEIQIMAVSYMRLISGAAVVPDIITPDCIGFMKDYLEKNYDVAVSAIEF